MESMSNKIKEILEIKDMTQKDFCEKSGRDTGNFNRLLGKDKYKMEELESIVDDLGYKLEIKFVDKYTGEKI